MTLPASDKISGTTTIPNSETKTDYALVSGGRASSVAAHIAIEHGPAKVAVHIDTGTGLDANREYVEKLADTFGWTLITIRTREDYEDTVSEYGFPGPGQHSKMYNLLKRRPLERLKAISEGTVGLWTGVYRAESDRRMGYVDPIVDGDRWTWYAPMYDWVPEDFETYVDAAGIPESDIWTELGRSGDCFCGAFATREELVDLEAAGYGDHADWLRNLETSVETGDQTEIWAWGSLSEVEQRGERHRRDVDQPTLCSGCLPPDDSDEDPSDDSDEDTDA